VKAKQKGGQVNESVCVGSNKGVYVSIGTREKSSKMASVFLKERRIFAAKRYSILPLPLMSTHKTRSCMSESETTNW